VEYGKDVIEKYSAVVDDYCRASGKRYKDYAAAIRNFMRKDGVEKRKTPKEQAEELMKKGI
jgi:hypothetical protein